MSLFVKRDTMMSSGIKSDFKIECDALTDDDLECIAYLISKLVKFRKVVSVPTGGDKLAGCLESYCSNDNNLPVLICDDVLTTGGSMERKREEIGEPNAKGAVIFSRGDCPEWITPLFSINSDAYRGG